MNKKTNKNSRSHTESNLDQFLTVRLDEKTDLKLKSEAKRLGVNTSILTRIAVNRLLDRSERIIDLIQITSQHNNNKGIPMKSDNKSVSEFKLQSLNEFNRSMLCAGVYAIHILDADDEEIRIKIFVEDL